MISSRHIAPVPFWGLTKQIGPWKTTSTDLSHEAFGYDSPHNQVQEVRPYQQDGSAAPTYTIAPPPIIDPNTVRNFRRSGLTRDRTGDTLGSRLASIIESLSAEQTPQFQIKPAKQADEQIEIGTQTASTQAQTAGTQPADAQTTTRKARKIAKTANFGAQTSLDASRADNIGAVAPNAPFRFTRTLPTFPEIPNQPFPALTRNIATQMLPGTNMASRGMQTVNRTLGPSGVTSLAMGHIHGATVDIPPKKRDMIMGHIHGATVDIPPTRRGTFTEAGTITDTPIGILASTQTTPLVEGRGMQTSPDRKNVLPTTIMIDDPVPVRRGTRERLQANPSSAIGDFAPGTQAASMRVDRVNIFDDNVDVVRRDSAPTQSVGRGLNRFTRAARATRTSTPSTPTEPTAPTVPTVPIPRKSSRVKKQAIARSGIGKFTGPKK